MLKGAGHPRVKGGGARRELGMPNTRQVCKGVGYPVSGLLMGALDWRFLTAAMWAANAAALAVLACARPASLGAIWAALNVFMAAQSVAGMARIAAAAGPWRALGPLRGQGAAGARQAG